MLRIECYPVMDGLMVRLVGGGSASEPCLDGENGASVQRTMPLEYVETVGLNEALREVLTDVINEYPGLLSWAVR